MVEQAFQACGKGKGVEQAFQAYGKQTRNWRPPEFGFRAAAGSAAEVTPR
jgi:hypothetical protein